jgi:hypothetical protein
MALQVRLSLKLTCDLCGGLVFTVVKAEDNGKTYQSVDPQLKSWVSAHRGPRAFVLDVIE